MAPVAQQSAESMHKPLSVSQAMALAKGALEACRVTLIGEVSEVSDSPRYKAVYFTVKDQNAALPCLMWKDRFRASGVDLRVGMLVQLTGSFTLYAAKGRMNFNVTSLQPAGEGDLRAKVAALAKKLQAEGLMAPERKRPLPRFPETVGLVTSPAGAAVHDVLRTLRRRYPLAHIVFAGVMVEGKGAPAALSEGIQAVVAGGAELVLLVRGGGSFEDLMPFNDEGLARMISACPVPVVTGIGHEPDTSIADMVADLRASTPTAAAEAIAPDSAQLYARLDNATAVLGGSLARMLEVRRLELNRIASRPVFSDSHALLAAPAQALDIAQDNLSKALPRSLERSSQALDAASKRLAAVGESALIAPRAACQSAAQRLRASGVSTYTRFDAAWRLSASRLNDLSPLAVVNRGYSVTRDEAGQVLRSVQQVPVGSAVHVQLADGILDCDVAGTSPLPQADPLKQ